MLTHDTTCYMEDMASLTENLNSTKSRVNRESIPLLTSCYPSKKKAIKDQLDLRKTPL